MTKNNPLKATDAHISIIGHITSEELLRNLTRTEMANGFANRFLMVCVKKSKQLPFGGSLSDKAISELRIELKQAVEFARQVGEMERDDEANEVWGKVYGKLAEGKMGLLGAVTSRAEPQVMRLACLYALMDLSNVIADKHLISALAVWEYVEASCRHIFGNFIGDPVADDILRSLRRAFPEGLSRTDISRLFSGHKDKDQIGRALASLHELGLTRCSKQNTSGAPVEIWTAIQ